MRSRRLANLNCPFERPVDLGAGAVCICICTHMFGKRTRIALPIRCARAESEETMGPIAQMWPVAVVNLHHHVAVLLNSMLLTNHNSRIIPNYFGIAKNAAR